MIFCVDYRYDSINVGNGLAVDLNFAQSITSHKFIADLKQSCASEDSMMVISFSRSALGQTGVGHFSPIGGFLLDFDLGTMKKNVKS